MFTHKIKCNLVHKLVIYFFHKMLNFVLCQVSTFHLQSCVQYKSSQKQNVSGKESLSLKGEPVK
jgi:hypothetical protein